ncbi:hypothetical protein GF359_07025 [candidate division WOR-3 bacterium]|uniref:2'-5' RNA ligase family protein n=1 Tax=candidate division WOR-3 bacterium TaxID=2052148 RepID=A0A9D5K9N3_UNCW3|nr:hypothetical protein [candidate division WOR-3 bacterium]MBD3364951.1 hypothetical protein [candidate division WOR-3 bacterium]
MPEMNVEPDKKKNVYGVVSLLHNNHMEKINKVWTELESSFGIKHLYEVPIPHFSYHVSADYPIDLLKIKLAAYTKGKKTFTVKTEGLGVFNTSEPVLYIPVVRNPVLSSFHRELWDLLSALAPEPLNYYHPDSWMPHITLIHGNIPEDRLPHVVSYLASKDFNWEIPVDNVSVICSSCSEVDPDSSFKLGRGT